MRSHGMAARRQRRLGTRQEGDSPGHHGLSIVGPGASYAVVSLRARARIGKGPWKLIGIGGHLAMPPLPHHRAYGSVPRRFGQLSNYDGSRYGRPSESKNAPGSAQQSALVRVI